MESIFPLRKQKKLVKNIFKKKWKNKLIKRNSKGKTSLCEIIKKKTSSFKNKRRNNIKKNKKTGAI